MSLFSDALSFGENRRQESAGECVTYARGEDQIEVMAVRGNSQFEEVPGDMEARVSIRMLPWLIRAEELVIDGAEVEPQRGDQIVSGDGLIYDVLPGPEGNHWRWSNQYKTTYRIHSVNRE